MKFLHVGCGIKTKTSTTPPFNSEQWTEIRLDIDEKVKPDIVGSITDMSSVQTGEFDAIFSSHNIEHIYPHEVDVALQEFHRVLNDRGFVMLTCPDLQSVCKLVSEDKLLEPAYESPAGPVAPIDILYGYRPPLAQGNFYMAHRTGFTQSSLTKTFRNSGFQSVVSARRVNHYDLFCLAAKQALPKDEILALARSHFPSD